MKTNLTIIVAALMVLSLSSCRKDDPVTPDDMFHFTAREDNLEVAMMLETDTLDTPSVPSLMYSLDGKNWTDFVPAVTTVKAAKAGDVIYFKANKKNTTFSALKISEEYYDTYTNGYCFTLSAKADVGGNIMYLLDGENPSSAQMGDAAFAALFYYCEDKLVDASKLTLPAAKLTPFCYFSMFCYCSSLIAVPELPATELARNCYDQMFDNCSSLENVPALPVTQMAYYCYRSMFGCCTSLKNAPELPATQLAGYCYARMFIGCTALVEAPSLQAGELKEGCYNEMFSKCSSLTKATVLAGDLSPKDCVTDMFYGITTSGTLTAAPGVNWTGIVPASWQVQVK